ncbi:MAG TPA: mercury(II) reductase [Chloroflexota bacterium]|nr:mercury(II) reductase [Chloroflexota bacterium]
MHAGALNSRFRLRVSGMTCPSCEHHVERALASAGAHDVRADFRRGDVVLSAPHPPDELRLAQAVEEAGYVAGPLKPVSATDSDDLVAYRMQVERMTCGDCERHVTDALREAGAVDPGANFRSGEANLSAPATIDPQRFVDALTPTPYRSGAIQRAAREPAEQRPVTAGSPQRFDVAIVGSGGGAFAAAIAASERGARVVMIERGTLGGTCVNFGCIPSKTQLRAGELFWQAGHHGFQGIRTEAVSVDRPRLVAQKDELVGKLRHEKYADLITAYGWELVHGEASFRDPHTLMVGDRAIAAGAFVLATGARPAVPQVPGLERVDYLTSTSLLDLKTLPTHLIVIGAGYVALELGQLFSHLGSRVTLMQRRERLLAEFDPEIGDTVRDVLTEEGIDVITGVTYVRAEQRGDRKLVTVRVGGQERTVEGDALLVATGRSPNTEALRLDRASVRTGARGEIVVDEYLRTSNPNVFAVGDVTLAPQFVYVAAHEGGVAAENALGDKRTVDLRAVPGVTFTRPAIGTVGLIEAAARQIGHDVRTSVLPLDAVPRALVNRETRGVIKIVADGHTNEVLGVHLVAENAGDVIYAGVLAVRFHLTVKDLTDTFAPYLTMSEALKLAAQSFERDVSKLSCCAA